MTDLQKKSNEKKDSVLISLLFNIVIPTLILTKLSSEDRLGPVYALVVGLMFPFLYGIYDFISRKKFNFISLLGIISIGLTGGFSLMRMDAFWIAVKEAAIPSVIGIFVLGTVWLKKPLIKRFLLKPEIMRIDKIEQILNEKNAHESFDKLLSKSTVLLSISFFISAFLNYFLAYFLLQSAPGTEAFNIELGKMTALSYPVILLPSSIIMIFALWYLVSGIKRITGLTLEEVLKTSSH